MEAEFSMAFSGCLFLTCGLIGIVLTSYASFIFSISILTEVIATFVVSVMGMYLLRASLNKIEDFVDEAEYYETEQSGRYSPFYYELEPVMQKRELPPIPRDIGRLYDAVITDKV